MKKAHTMKLDRARISYKTRSSVSLCSIDSDSEEIKLVVPIYEINEIYINDNDLHSVNKAGQKRAAKFSPRRDEPCVVLTYFL